MSKAQADVAVISLMIKLVLELNVLFVISVGSFT